MPNSLLRYKLQLNIPPHGCQTFVVGVGLVSFTTSTTESMGKM